jgi:hypothetical protein
MRTALLVFMGLFSCLFGSCAKHSAESTASEKSASKFRAGQVWAIHTPSGQPNARLTVLRVEDGGQLGPIVHIALSEVSYGNGQTTIQHLPFAESAVERSVTNLEVASAPLPPFDEGYRLWREAFDAGKAGVFTITVAEAYDAVTGIARRTARPLQ